MWGLPGRLRRTGRVTNLVLIYWDFFPLLQYEIGRLKYPIFAPLLKAVERRAIAPADRIAVMTPKNAEYLDRYFPQLPSEIQIIPPWSESGLFFEPSEDKWKSPVLKVIHGGQLVPGRDIGVLLDAARLLEADAESRGQFEFVIAGDGTEREPLERRAAGLHTVRFTGNLDRDDYQALLRECHLGIAISTPNKTAPTFPSKISEYAGTGIPILVAIEDCSDAGHIVVQFGAGYNIPAGDPAGLAGSLRAALKELRDGTLRERGEQARELWKEELSVESAVRHLSAGLGD